MWWYRQRFSCAPWYWHDLAWHDLAHSQHCRTGSCQFPVTESSNELCGEFMTKMEVQKNIYGLCSWNLVIKYERYFLKFYFDFRHELATQFIAGFSARKRNNALKSVSVQRVQNAYDKEWFISDNWNTLLIWFFSYWRNENWTMMK